MVGSGLVAFPYTFESSGFLLGIIVSIIGFIASSRTCILIIRTAGNDDEYFDTLYKYWGSWAYYCGAVSTWLIILTAACSYFIIMSQMLYPIILAPIDWFSTSNVYEETGLSFTDFSPAYVTLMIFAIEVVITMRKDLTVFIKVASFGSIFIISLILFIIGVGIYSLTNTTYKILDTHTIDNVYDSSTNVRYLYLINTNFS